MKTINYQVKKQIIQVEVSDDFAIEYEKVTTEYKRNEWKHERAYRRHISSYDELTEAGVQFEDKQSTPEDDLIRKELKQILHKAIRQLTPEQQKLVRDVFFVGKSQTQYAKENGIERTAVVHRLQRAIASLKKFFEKFDS